MVIYREDQEFNVNELIPTKKKSDNKFDLIIASQPVSYTHLTLPTMS